MRTATAPHAMPLESLLRKADVAGILNLGMRTLERQISAGSFPPPDCRLGLGQRIPAWKPETVRRWIEGR